MEELESPADVARAAVWLASGHSDYVVGNTLFIDGGTTLYPGFTTGGRAIPSARLRHDLVRL